MRASNFFGSIKKCPLFQEVFVNHPNAEKSTYDNYLAQISVFDLLSQVVGVAQSGLNYNILCLRWAILDDPR